MSLKIANEKRKNNIFSSNTGYSMVFLYLNTPIASTITVKTAIMYILIWISQKVAPLSIIPRMMTLKCVRGRTYPCIEPKKALL